MTAPADTAAGRIRAFLDARPERDDYESSDIILTEPDPNPGAGRRWLHLTRADLRAVLAEREQLVARIAELEGERDRVLIEDDGRCDDCNCCSHDGCHRFADATCPTNSLGDSVCPCTED